MKRNSREFFTEVRDEARSEKRSPRSRSTSLPMQPLVIFDCVVCLQGAGRETGPAGLLPPDEGGPGHGVRGSSHPGRVGRRA